MLRRMHKKFTDEDPRTCGQCLRQCLCMTERSVIASPLVMLKSLLALWEAGDVQVLVLGDYQGHIILGTGQGNLAILGWLCHCCHVRSSPVQLLTLALVSGHRKHFHSDRNL